MEQLTYEEIVDYFKKFKFHDMTINSINRSSQIECEMLNLRIDEYVRFLDNKQGDINEWQLKVSKKIFNIDIADCFTRLKNKTDNRITKEIDNRISAMYADEIDNNRIDIVDDTDIENLIKELDDKTNLNLNIESIKNNIIGFEKNRHIIDEIKRLSSQTQRNYIEERRLLSLLEMLKTKKEYRGESIGIINYFIDKEMGDTDSEDSYYEDDEERKHPYVF